MEGRYRGKDVLSFVLYEGPKLPKDAEVRRLIRQHAMTDVAANRRRRGYGKRNHNRRQEPILWDGDHTPNLHLANALSSVQLNEVSDSTEDGAIAYPTGTPVIGQRNYYSSPGPSSVSLVCRNQALPPDFFLLLEFVPLAGLRLGISTLSNLAVESCRTGDLLSTPHPGGRRLLNYIPSRYHQVSSLQHATDCVVGKLRLLMQPAIARSPSDDARVLLSYSKALKALQAALNDGDQWMTAETLCATELLGVFEALSVDREADSWIRHICGAAQLIKTRGAHRFESDFERALFMAHVGPTVMEAFLSNEMCFLAEKPWLQVMRAAIYSDNSLGTEKEIVCSLWSYLARGPALFRATTNMVLSSKPPSQHDIDSLIGLILYSQNGLATWMGKALEKAGEKKEDIKEMVYGLATPKLVLENGKLSPRYVTHLTLRGTYNVCRMIKARLLYALAPAKFPHLEVECQELASRIISLKQESVNDQNAGLVWSIFMAQSIWIANGVLKTKKIWSDGLHNGDGMIDQWRFEAWNKAIGRKSPNVTGVGAFSDNCSASICYDICDEAKHSSIFPLALY